MPPLAIVTGANSGIGKEVANELLKRDYQVVMACRSLERCNEARADLVRQNPDSNCTCMELDLSDYNSIRRFSKELVDKQQPVNLLINNAGVMGKLPSSNSDSYDGHMKPNHLGPFLLTRLIMPLMGGGNNPRIVNVGSEAHYRGSLKFEEENKQLRLTPPSPWHWYLQYARSKLCNALMTAELTRQFKQRGSSVTAYCVSPGRVNTNIFQGNKPAKLLASLFFQTPQQGAQTVLYAALDPHIDGSLEPTYLHNMAVKEPSVQAQDPLLSKQLWRFSVQETGLSQQEDTQDCWPTC